MPVDLYVGGAEHAVLHLLYSRFWHKVLFDAGFVSTDEPFQKLINQGLITSFSFKDASDRYVHADLVEFDGQQALHKETGEALAFQVEKMSKAKGNVVNPDHILKEFGADSFRLYEMFMGPLEMSKPWNTKSIDGVRRFLERAWRLVFPKDQEGLADNLVEGCGNPNLEKLFHRTIKGVTEDIENLRLNTAISKLMVLVNGLTKEKDRPRETVEGLLVMLAPFAPHIAEELWQALGHQQSVSLAPWPQFDETLCKQDKVTIVIQVNGKKRDDFQVPADQGKDQVIASAKTREKILPWLENVTMIKEIYVPNRLVNLVVRPN